MSDHETPLILSFDTRLSTGLVRSISKRAYAFLATGKYVAI